MPGKNELRLLFCVLLLLLPAAGKSQTRHENYLRIVLSDLTVEQGSTVTVFVDSAKKLKKLELDCFGHRHPIYRIWHKKFDHMFRSFVGAPIRLKPGKYKIMARAVDIHNQKLQIYQFLQVKKKRFKLQKIDLPPRKRSLLSAEILHKEANLIGKRLKSRDKRVYFAAPFRLPVNGRISAPFGGRRQYNDGAVSSYHKGLDIANKRGTPVKASNGGKVTLAKSFKAHGKTALIDHGHGIVTIYCHMDSIKVKAGEWVKKGQVIGGVGSTGIANGPHLHFGLSVNDTRVDPTSWIKRKVKLYY